MRRTIAALFLLVITACTTIQPGHVGILVNQWGSHRGVSDYPVTTGFVSYNPISTTVFEWPTFVQTAVWTSDLNEGRQGRNDEITFNSKEGLTIKANVSLSYQLDPEKIPQFYVQFRTDNLDAFTHGFLHNVARNAFNEEAAKYTVEELYSTRKEEMLNAVKGRINAEVSQYGVRIDQFGYIGAPVLPDNVLAALNSKIQAIQDAQRAQNQVAQATANAQIAVAKAKGEADANMILTRSLSPELIRWRQLMISQQAVEKWNGTLPTYTAGGGIPLIQLPTDK